MKAWFSSAATLSEAEQALKTWGIKYERQPDGSLFVPGDLNISSKGLARLPDLSSIAVGGNFSCGNNRLTSLEGAPLSVGGDFSCNSNQLTSLEHAPQSVGSDFLCYNNRLTSLEHAPQSVGGGFYCRNNQLTLLEHAPQIFKKLRSDFGEFVSWEAVPENLRTSPETKARMEQERLEQAESAVQHATVLQTAMAVKRPLRLKIASTK